MDLIGIPGNAIPKGLISGMLRTRDGTSLRVARSTGAGARGTAVIVCGRGDFIERYFETIGNLTDRGFAVAIYDPRGQGGSGRPLKDRYRSRMSSFAEYDDDLISVMTQWVLPNCPPPYLALGHSTGGNTVLRALRSRAWFSKAVVSAPLLGVHAGAWPMPVARALAALVSRIGLGWMFLPGQMQRPLTAFGFDGNAFTTDRARFSRDASILEAEPRLGLGGPTFSWLHAAFRAMDELHALPAATSLKAPVLIVAAGRDRIVDTEAARRFARRATNVSFVSIPEAQHEILAECDAIREQFLAAFDAFTASPVPSRSRDDSQGLVQHESRTR